MSKLTLTSEEASELKGKAVGEECVTEVTLTVTKNDESGFEADIVSVEPVEGYEESEIVEGEDEPTAAVMGKKHKGKPALMLVIGAGKEK